MVNSGAMGNFIHPRFIEVHKLVTKPCEPLVVNDVNGQLLSHVDQQAEIRMTIGGHSKTLTFNVAPLGKHNIVLGLRGCSNMTPLCNGQAENSHLPRITVRDIVLRSPQAHS
jgi:hypothetical protein